MPPHEFTRRAFSRTAGSAFAAPLAASLPDSLTARRPSARWRFDAGTEILVLPGFFRDASVVGDTLFVEDGEIVRAIDRATGDQRWQFDAEDEHPGLEVGANAAYVPMGDALRSFDADGSNRWTFETDSQRHDLYGARAVDESVYASSTGHLYALDAESGDERWRFDENLGTPVVAHDAVYGTASELTAEILYALDPADGTERWRFEIEREKPSDLVDVDGRTCYLWNHGDLYALDADDGAESWRFATNDDSLGFRGRVTEGSAYVWDRSERTLYALDSHTGTEKWRFDAESDPRFVTHVVGDAVVTETDGAVSVLDATDGTERWRRPREVESAWFAGDVTESTVYSHDGGALYALDAADGSVKWQFDPVGEQVAYAQRIGDAVYAGTNEGRMYALTGPIRTPLAAVIDAARANAGPLALAALLGGGLVAEALRRAGGSSESAESEPAGEAVELLEPIDAGGPLESYEARLPDGRAVVAKRLSERADATREQFLEAVETWAELNHEGVRPVLDRGTDPTPWVALPPATGPPVAECEDLTVAERVEALAEACETVHAVHRRGVTHGQLSPNDVRLRAQERQPADVRVGGWLARILSEAEWRSAYAAPERADDREADPVRTDVYRLGAVAYHAVTGQPPDRDATDRTPPSELNAEVPTEIDDVLADAMAADPDERYRSALKLADMLRWAVRQ